jgi:hypothetical protein
VTWPRRATTPAVTVNDRGNDNWTYIACPTCAFWEAKLIPTVRELQGPGQGGMVRYTNRVACPHCDA